MPKFIEMKVLDSASSLSANSMRNLLSTTNVLTSIPFGVAMYGDAQLRFLADGGNCASQLKYLLFLAAVLLIPENAYGAAPIPFDLFGLIRFVALYLLGLVALLTVLFLAKDKAAKRITALLFSVYVIGPAAFIFIAVKVKEERNERQLEELRSMERREKERSLGAFAGYCQGRKRALHGKAFQEGGVSLVVRIERDFTGRAGKYSADSLSGYLHYRPDLCKRTGVKFIEGIYEGGYSLRNGYERDAQGVHRFSVCEDAHWIASTFVQAKYELVLGRSGNKVEVPGTSSWMSSSSVEIAERSSGRLLAEDTMYFLDNETGESGCPSGMEQLSELLVDVFRRH